MESQPRLSGFTTKLIRWNIRHPLLAMVLVSVLAVVVNCHPVIFCGRSFVYPALMKLFVYAWPPIFPGMESAPDISSHGSDTWCGMVQQVPAGFIDARDLAHGELPLWNRYAHAGQPYLGQTITMLGDPLQWIVIAGRGSALAWDLKFLAGKFLFSLGFGLLVWRVIGSQALGLLFAALGPYCGAFFFANIHPVFFDFVYAPWILLSGLRWLDPSARDYFRWGLVWLLADIASFSGGHVEVAVILIAGINVAGLAGVLTICRRGKEMVVVVGRMAIGGLLFVCLTSPVWLSFLVALQGSYSTHNEIRVAQLPLLWLPGLFDEMVTMKISPDPASGLLPGTSLLVLAGCLLSVLYWRRWRRERLYWVNLGIIALWGGCIFGWVPAPVLIHIPLLNHDGHTTVDFSYLLVIHLTLQSAYGFYALAGETSLKKVICQLLWMIPLVGLFILDCHLCSPRPAPVGYFLFVGLAAVAAPLLFMYWRCYRQQSAVLFWTLIIMSGLAVNFRFGVYARGNPGLFLVGPRMALDAPSPAIEKIKATDPGVYRVTSLQNSLLGDYPAVYELEDIRSCDPLASGDFIDLVPAFPGMRLDKGWMLAVQDPAVAEPMLDLLNIKYVLAAPDSPAPGGDLRVASRDDFTVLENPDVWPRAFFSDHVISQATTAEFIGQLSQSGRQPFVSLTPTELAKEPAMSALAGSTAEVVPATHYELGANSTAFDIQAPSAGVVCLLEAQAKDFTARANGDSKTVFTANRAFKAIYLDHPGNYHIQFTFRPRYWSVACGMFFSALGMIVLLAIFRIAVGRRTSGP